MKKTALTDAIVAALAEGIPALAAAGAPEASPGTAVDPKDPDNAAAAAADAAAATAAPEVAPGAVEAFLKEGLAAAQLQVAELTVQVKAAADAFTAAKTATEGFRAIAQASTTRLRVALGRPQEGVEALGDDALLAEHAALRGAFESKFKVGGVAAVTTDPQKSQPGAERENALRQARLAATRVGN